MTTSLKLMIVDRDAAQMDLVQRALVQAGYSNIASTSEPEDAARVFREVRPDILLLDIAEPTSAEFQDIEHMGDRRDAQGVLVPLLVLTANGSSEIKRRAFAAGADDVLVKPFENEEVVARVKNLLQTRRLDIKLTTYNQRLEREVEARTKALRESESSLLQAQKMDAVGQLAGGIAHDFNNLLSVIIGYAALLLEDVAEEDPRHDDLLEIKNAGERAALLTRQLLAFSRKEVVRPIVLDLNHVIGNVETLLRRTIRGNIDLKIQFQRELPHVKMDPGQLEQVLVNLVVNARDALVGSGTIRIRTREVNLDHDFAARHPGAIPGWYVSTEVHDDGSGMTSEVKNRLFEPFFTTKERGVGTGLGLATVYGIVKQAGGYIDVESAVDRGTTVHVYIPATKEELDEGSPASNGSRAVGEGQSILVAEDEAVVRHLVERLLKRNGFKVTAVATGEQARQFIESDKRSVDLLLTDVVMPGISGVKLARDVNAMWPHIPVILMSGYTDSDLGEVPIRAELLRKPFEVNDLLEAVDAALRRAGGVPE